VRRGTPRSRAVLLRTASRQLRDRGRQPGPRTRARARFSTSRYGGVRRASGEVTYFRNDISDYVFRAPLTEAEFESRLPEFAARFPDRGIGEEPLPTDEFPIVENIAADSILQGIESHADFQLMSGIALELGLDYVRGTLKDTDEPLPRIPPLRFRGGLRYQRNAFQAGGEVTATAKQDRSSTETRDRRISTASSLPTPSAATSCRTRSRRGSTT
jgi:outer membrane receptor for ferrienterochelin and colicin